MLSDAEHYPPLCEASDSEQPRESSILRVKKGSRVSSSDGQVIEIMRLMLDGEWRPGLTIHELAKTWGQNAHYVQKLATDAGRMIRVSMAMDKDALTGMMFAKIESLCDLAKRIGKPGDAIRGIELQAKLLKLIDSPRGNEVMGVPTRSAREALEFVESMIPELRAKLAAEEALMLEGE